MKAIWTDACAGMSIHAGMPVMFAYHRYTLTAKQEVYFFVQFEFADQTSEFILRVLSSSGRDYSYNKAEIDHVVHEKVGVSPVMCPCVRLYSGTYLLESCLGRQPVKSSELK